MARWRKTDPDTSRDAALSVTEETVTMTQKRILEKLQVAMTDQELVEQFHIDFQYGESKFVSDSGIRSRRAELVVKGLVVDSGLRMKLASGRFGIMWKVAGRG